MRPTLLAVVDDHEEISELIRLIITIAHEGIDVRIVPADDRVFQRQRWEDVDVGLIDMNMPFASGETVLEWLAKNKPTIRRVAMSANDIPQYEPDRLQWAHAFLRKPFYRDQIEDLLGL